MARSKPAPPLEGGGTCEVHGDEPDPRLDPGAAIEWIELHHGDLYVDTNFEKLRVVPPQSTVCRPRRRDADTSDS